MSLHSNTTIIQRYLHGQDDEYSDLWPTDAVQQRRYHYSLYEVCVDLEVDLDTGDSRIVAIDGALCEGEWQ